MDAFDTITPDLMFGQKGPSVHFRLDDDDAIACNTVHNLKRLGSHAAPGTLLSLPSGLNLFEHGGRSYLIPKFEPYIAIALAFVNPQGKYRNPFRCAHKREYRTSPSLMDPNPAAYIHTAHVASDTQLRHGKRFDRIVSQVENYDSDKYQTRLKRRTEKFFPGFTPDRFFDALRTLPSRAESLEKTG